MSSPARTAPPWLATVLLAKDDTEESVMGSDWHQEAILQAHGPLLDYAQRRQPAAVPPWYVSSQVTVIVPLPRRARPWQPKPDLFVVVGVQQAHRTSYDTRREGPMPQFVLEVASESTWQDDVEDKRDLYAVTGVQEYLVFDPTGTFLAEQVRAWRAAEGGWELWPAEVRADGQRVWQSGVLGLGLRVEGALVRLDHPQLGPLPLGRELWAARELAEELAAQEQAARRAAEERATRKEEARRAAEERATREEEARRAAEQRATDLERDLKALQVELARLRARGPEGRP